MACSRRRARSSRVAAATIRSERRRRAGDEYAFVLPSRSTAAGRRSGSRTPARSRTSSRSPTSRRADRPTSRGLSRSGDRRSMARPTRWRSAPGSRRCRPTSGGRPAARRRHARVICSSSARGSRSSWLGDRRVTRRGRGAGRRRGAIAGARQGLRRCFSSRRADARLRTTPTAVRGLPGLYRPGKTVAGLVALGRGRHEGGQELRGGAIDVSPSCSVALTSTFERASRALVDDVTDRAALVGRLRA